MLFLQKKIFPTLIKVGKWAAKRKYRILIAFVAALAACVGILREGGPVREEDFAYLTGEGSFFLSAEKESEFRQEFIPRYTAVLDSVGISFHKEGTENADCTIYLTVRDLSGSLLFERKLDYEEINNNSYTYIDVDVRLKKNTLYQLCIQFDRGDESVVGVNACGREYELAENQDFYQGDTKLDSQLVTMYSYSDFLPGENVASVCFLVFLAALGIAAGPPKDKKWNCVFGAGVFLMAPPVLGYFLEMLATDMTQLTPVNLWINIGLIYALWLILLLLTMSWKVTVTAGTFSVSILYIINYYFMRFRGTPFKLGELRAWRTALKVVGNYDYSSDKRFVLALLMIAIVLIWGVQIRSLKVRIYLRVCSCAAGLIGFAAGTYIISEGNMLENAGMFYSGAFNQQYAYRVNGYLASTMLDVKNSTVEKPDEYNRNRVQDILAEYTADQGGSEDAPHIIMIMNESFSDLRVLGNLELSQENMEFWKNLDRNSIKGYVHASVLGGGTANSEFEVFTGCTKAFFPPAYYAYLQCMSKERESLVSMVKEQGYHTVAMHPESMYNWNRKQVYEILGFDECLWRGDFGDCEIVHSGVSDAETYRKIIEIFEGKEEGEKLFIWDLTMQNHGGYAGSSVDTQVHAANMESEAADKYLSLVKISDEAIEELIHYFAGEEEKVIICIFGDHQPIVDDQGFYEKLSQATPGQTEEERLMAQHMTPFLIWANYDIQEEENIELSMNYVGVLLLKTAGLSYTPYFAYLDQQMENYPVITANGWKKREEEGYHLWGEQQDDPFDDYRVLQYFYLFDS